jgi:outer membrane biosynthesis protein TonB
MEAERDYLLRALLLSLMLHLALFGVLEAGRTLGWWRDSPLSWLSQRRMAKLATLSPALAQTNELRRQQEVPLLFVDVNPAHAEEEPPPKSQYYSSLNTRAANPETTRDTNIPKVEGRQDKVIKTFDTLRPDPEALVMQPAPQPVLTPQPPQPQVQTELKPRGGLEAGELTLGSPAPTPGPDEGKAETKRPGQAEPERPRTLAAARLARGMIAGEKMKQEGGVKRSRVETTLDVRATKYGAYDALIVSAIQQRWYFLLDQRELVAKSGRVVLEFHLNHDGRVTHLRVLESDVGDFLTLLCQKAVQDPSPFPAWPADMRREMPKDYRDVRFTFYYY